MFEVAEAYERHRGRSSKLLAPLFIDFVGVQCKVLDMGCGTGALTFTIAKSQAVPRIVGIDRSQGFINYARSQNEDALVMIAVGCTQNLLTADASIYRTMTQ